MAAEIAKLPESQKPAICCIVGANAELMPGDYSEVDLWCRTFPTKFAYYSRLHYFPVRGDKKDNIDKLCRFIGTRVIL